MRLADPCPRGRNKSVPGKLEAEMRPWKMNSSKNEPIVPVVVQIKGTSSSPPRNTNCLSNSAEMAFVNLPGNFHRESTTYVNWEIAGESCCFAPVLFSNLFATSHNLLYEIMFFTNIVILLLIWKMWNSKRKYIFFPFDAVQGLSFYCSLSLFLSLSYNSKLR